MKKLFIALLFIFSTFIYAEEGHGLSTIQGTNIDLKTYDHAFAGSINGIVAWGFLDESTFSSELIIRKYELTTKTIFKKNASGQLGGEIIRMDGNKIIKTSIFVTGLDPENKKIQLNINGEEVIVSIYDEGYVDGHFINPEYRTIINGTPINYKMYGGACFGMSMHFAMMILGAYLF